MSYIQLMKQNSTAHQDKTSKWRIFGVEVLFFYKEDGKLLFAANHGLISTQCMSKV